MNHVPVLLNEVIRFLDPKPDDFVVDGTVDGGGHASEFLKRLGENGTFLGFEWDGELFEKFSKELPAKRAKAKVILKNANYAELPSALESEKLKKPDILFLDLGFSSEQLEGRGLSFDKDEPLDMRFGNSDYSAKDAVNCLRPEELAKIFKEFGEERFAFRIAARISEARKKKRIETTRELSEIVKGAVPGNYERGRLHPATRVFQALRIYVNNELDNLESVLVSLKSVMAPGGRVGIISFHSLEDRAVKNAFRNLSKSGYAELLTKKPVTADAGELRENPRSRSAKFRAIRVKTHAT